MQDAVSCLRDSKPFALGMVVSNRHLCLRQVESMQIALDEYESDLDGFGSLGKDTLYL